MPLMGPAEPSPVLRESSGTGTVDENLDRIRRHLQALIDAEPECVKLVAPDGTLLDMNAAGLAMVEADNVEMLRGQSVFALVVPEHREAFMAMHDRVCAGGNETLEFEIVGLRGTRRWMETHAVPLQQDGFSAPVHLAIARDITARKKAEDLLQRQRAELQLVFDAVPALIFIKDLDHRLVRLNQEFVRLTGRPLADLAGRTDAEAGSPYAELYHRDEDEIVASGLPKRNIIEPFKAEAGTRWLRTDKFPYRDDAGRIVGVIGFAVDITERLNLEKQLLQAQKMEAVGQLAGGIAHDFNNLLTIILGYSEGIMERMHSHDPLRAQVAQIANAGQRAAALTRQLLAFSRKQILAPRVIDLNEQVAATGRMLTRLIGADVRLSTVLDPALHRVKVDPGQMEQVILNLAVNARDAMPRGGNLTIETRNIAWHDDLLRDCAEINPGRLVLLSVSDTGCGMTPEVQAHIFDPFFTTKPPDKGTGLGLATVYGIVTQSGGRILVETAVDVGTTFRIILPAALESPVAEEPGGHLPACSGRETVLLVEDEDQGRELTRCVLVKCGYTVLEAASGRSALSVAEGHAGRIDILVTDVVMPEMSGRQLADLLTARRQGLKVLYISGYTDDAVVRHGIVETQRAFLPKPFTSTSLAKKVREVLEAVA